MAVVLADVRDSEVQYGNYDTKGEDAEGLMMAVVLEH